MRKCFIWLIVLLGLHVNLYGVSFNAEERNYLDKKYEITMCIDPDWLPFEKDNNNEHIGMVGDYMRHLSSLIKTPIVLISTQSWAQSLEFAKQRKCDIISSAIDTPARRAFLNFTEPSLQYSVAIVTTNDKSFVDSMDTISDKKLAIVKGYAFGELLQNRYPKLQFIGVDTLEEGFNLVRKGVVFGYIDPLPVLAYAIQKNAFESLKINGKFDEKWNLCIGVRNDEPLLLSVFNKAIKAVDEQVKTEIINRWISRTYEQKPNYTLVVQVGLIALALILFMVYRYLIVSHYNTQLKKAVNSFEVLVESTIEGIILFDKTMHCIMVNQAAVDIFGYSKKEFKGLHYSALVHEDFLESVTRRFDSSQLPPHEVLSIKKDGTFFTAYTRGVNSYWKGEKVRISFVVDITEYKQLQSNLEQRVQMHVQEIEQKNQMLGQQHKLVAMGEMIGAISHQWRQPLNALSINIQNLEDDYQEGLVDEEFIVSFVTHNHNIIEYMSKTIDDFRNFFRIDKEKQSFSVHKTITETLHLQSAQLRNYFIDIELLGEDFTLYTFKSEFQQVLLNLISNARDAIIERKHLDGKITMTTSASCICVEDNGGGIDESVLERIFEPYFTTKEQGKGIGLGLYISKMIVEQHMGGTLRVHNSAQGACFTLCF